MQSNLKTIGAWAPLMAALSMLVYGVALEWWPLRAGHVFAAVFRLDPVTLAPIQGWPAVLPGIAIWIAACYAAVAVGWALWHTARWRSPQTSQWVPQDAAVPLTVRRSQD